jgi:hypothetical protein
VLYHLTAARDTAASFPQGFVRSADAAVASLGGLAGDQPTVHLRPGDPLSHPLRGERRGASGLVLRLDATTNTCRPVLCVDTVCRFTGLADAQYLSAAPVKKPRLGEDAFGAVPDAVEDMEEDTPLLVVPPRFFHSDAPLEYGFRSAFTGQPAAAAAAVAAQEGGGQGGGAGAAKGGALATTEIDFRATDVPQVIPADSEFAPPPAVEAVLGPLFQERLVWSNAALGQRLPTGAAGAQLRRYIPSYAYRFVNGPWHRQWVKRGLDPRVDPSAGPFQCLDYRLPKEWYPRPPRRGVRAGETEAGGEQAGGQGGGTPSPSRGRFDQVHTLRALPARRTTFFALFDLNQPLIKHLVHQPAQRGVCDEHNGWYVKTTLDAVKAILRDAFEACALAEGFAAIPQKVRVQAKHSKAARVQAVLEAARQRMDAEAAGGGVPYVPRHGGAQGRGDFALADEDEEDSEEGPDSSDSEDLPGPAHTGAAFAAALGRAPAATGHTRLVDAAEEALDDADVYDVFDD